MRPPSGARSGLRAARLFVVGPYVSGPSAVWRVNEFGIHIDVGISHEAVLVCVGMPRVVERAPRPRVGDLLHLRAAVYPRAPGDDDLALVGPAVGRACGLDIGEVLRDHVEKSLL